LRRHRRDRRPGARRRAPPAGSPPGGHIRPPNSGRKGAGRRTGGGGGDERRCEDLFWALRGAGAQGLGVVTRLTLRTVAEPAATSFHLKWPYELAPALIAAWQAWSPTGPDELAATLLVTAGGEAGADPVVHLFGSMIGSESEAAALLDDFVS